MILLKLGRRDESLALLNIVIFLILRTEKIKFFFSDNQTGI